MAYEFERDEWRSALRSMTEADRYVNTNATRWAQGIIGDPTDDIGADHDSDGDGDGDE